MVFKSVFILYGLPCPQGLFYQKEKPVGDEFFIYTVTLVLNLSNISKY